MEPPNTRLIKPSEAPRRLSSSLDIPRIDELGWNFRVPNPDREVGGREQMGLFFFFFILTDFVISLFTPERICLMLVYVPNEIHELHEEERGGFWSHTAKGRQT